MGQALPKAALRPYLAEDGPVLAAIFVASIEGLTGDDYSEAQQEAWAAAVDDEVEFGQRLASGLTLVATLEGVPVGFASLKGKDHVDLLYVHPDAVGQGVASMLWAALSDLIHSANSDKVAEYRSGKDKLFGFFVGQVMRAMAGKGNPALVNETLKRKLA